MRFAALIVASALLLAALLLGARELGASANLQRGTWPKESNSPYAPAPAAAPFISLGYREMMADLLWLRVINYFVERDDRASTLRALVEAIIALDPRFEHVYEWSGIAIPAGHGVTTGDLLATIEMLKDGAKRFPDNYQILFRAGEIYTIDLQSDDPTQKATWELEGAKLLERAVRMPGAPTALATFAAHIRSKLGQRIKAVQDLRELIAYTTNPQQRETLLRKLAQLTEKGASELVYELAVERQRFDVKWQTERPELKPSMYVLVGPRLSPRFSLDDLAVERDLIGTEEAIEHLPPLAE